MNMNDKCQLCRGEGRLDCDHCDGDNPHCERCCGDGNFECEDCFGTGEGPEEDDDQ